ncbi:MAG TPA: carboxypeptidase-like regulatory domain-containing protein, partial [Pirellulales bacterium]|nr:carboxypeptidase-like regulatory domain-containing protein [Pirellulales bacterium]
MAAQRKTWREKLADSKDLPKVMPISGKMTRRWGRGTVVVPAPSEVDAVMKRVPRGKLITINEIRAALARKHSATIGCPITTGIFAWIAAHAAEEAAAEGANRITPYWRTLKTGGELNAKYPGGIEQLKKRLAAEGHHVVAKGKRWLVADFEKRLARLLALLVLLTASIVGAADDAPAVVGTVVDDQNQPVAGADIYLFDGPPRGRQALFDRGSKTRQPPPLVGRATSNASGEFELPLPVELPQVGHGPTWLALAVHQSGVAVKARLIGRDWPPRAKPIRVELSRPRNNRLQIQSPDYEPIAHARLRVEQVAGIHLPAELSTVLAAESDESGEATLPDVAGEELRTVSVESRQFGAQWAPLARNPMGEASIVVLAPVGRISGRLIDETGAPVVARHIHLATWVDPRDELAGGGMADVASDAEGRFATSAIAAGALQVAVELAADSPLLCLDKGTQSIEAETTSEVAVRFQHGVRVRGTVIDQADRRPLAGAVVSLGLAPGSPLVETNEAGEYTGLVLPGSTHLAFFRLPPDYHLAAGRIPDEVVPEKAKEMTFKPLLAAAGATLSGRVIDQVGQPVPGAEVTGVCTYSDGGDRLIHARTDRDGNFMLAGVATNANVLLTAQSAAGVAAAPVVAHVHDPDLVTLKVASAGALSLSGRAVDAERLPLAGAAVRILALRIEGNRPPIEEGFLVLDGHERIYTDADGRFATPKQLRPDRRYRVEVDALGMMPVRTEMIDPSSWQTTDFGDIVLEQVPRVRSVAGKVVDVTGRPIAGAVIAQSGDGPCRTRTFSDANGNFRLRGIYEGPAWLFVSHSESPLQAERIERDARDVQIVLRRDSAAPPGARAISPLGSPDQTEALVVRALFDKYRARWERAGAGQWAAATEYLFDKNLPAQHAGNIVQSAYSSFMLGYRLSTPDQATELAQATADAYLRGTLYLAACEALGNAPDRRRDDLAEALLAARAVDSPGYRISLLSEIALRFFDLGDREVGAAIVREAHDQVLKIPFDGVPDRLLLQGKLAPALAYLDAPAAMAMADKLRRPTRDGCLFGIARSLADESPADAEQALERMESTGMRFEYGAGTVHRMASIDPERAARIARKFLRMSWRAYGLGLVAHAQAAADPPAAARFIEEAYGVLEQSLADGSATVQDNTSGTAAAMLPIVERVDPAMIAHYLGRALALRPPRPARGDTMGWYEGEIAQLALAVAPYDRQTARTLLEPLAQRLRTLSAVGAQYGAPRQIWAALAVVDADWARQLLDLLPDTPPEVSESPRATAARHIVDVLACRGAVRWPSVYKKYLHLRHPDTPVR